MKWDYPTTDTAVPQVGAQTDRPYAESVRPPGADFPRPIRHDTSVRSSTFSSDHHPAADDLTGYLSRSAMPSGEIASIPAQLSVYVERQPGSRFR